MDQETSAVIQDGESLADFEQRREQEVKQQRERERRAARSTSLTAGLRELANVIEANPQADWPSYRGSITINLFAHSAFEDEPTPEQAQAWLAETARAFGGTWIKNANSSYFELRRSFGSAGLVSLALNAERAQVCVARVVGQETVEISDYSAVPKKTVTRDVIEWECAPALTNVAVEEES